MNYRIILIFCVAIIFSTQSFAQLSKKEKKEWKKKAKEYSKKPSDLKQLIEDKQAADNQVSALNRKTTELQGSIASKDTRIAELEDQLNQTRGQDAHRRVACPAGFSPLCRTQ